ncbi:outer membrane beta-barrel protein [Bradyrhizobium sp. AS23.2]|uniref:outer membrane protein n=1 Tax=Bradyrhizobium sp. AS23.2 TaxID=1680155 RepID=UPI0032DEB182
MSLAASPGGTPISTSIPPRGDIIGRRGHYQTGWTAGLGLEYAVSGNWTAKAEYEYVDLSGRTYDLSGFGLNNVNVEPRVHLFKLGLNYQFGDTPWIPPRRRQDETAGIQRLECPRADDVPATGLRTDPLALCRSAKPSRRRPAAGDVDNDGLPGRAALGRR